MTKEERKEYNKQYYQKNKEKHSQQMKLWYNDKKDNILEHQKKYREDNKEKVLKRAKQYRETKFGKAARFCSAYKKNDEKYNRGKCTLTAQWIVDNIFSKSCHYCGETDWHLLGCDRINNDLPHTPKNVVPCCKTCNWKRHLKPFEEFCKEMEITQ